jgi:pimeloyl-ACP methyl ester carboxylesterase
VQAHVHTYGRTVAPNARRVFLIHGAGMDQSVWTLQGRWLAFHGWNAFAVDLPGHGRSRGEPALPTVEAMADWLVALLAETGTAPAWLIGHSMGALVALETAARQRDQVAGLCLLGAAPRLPVHPELLQLAQAADPKVVELMLDWSFGPRGHVGGSPLPGGWLQGTARSLLLRGDPAVLASDLRACDGYRGGAAAAAAFTGPALVIAGGEDRMTPPRAARELVGLLAKGELVAIAEAGHMMMVEAPDATLEALRRVLG